MPRKTLLPLPQLQLSDEEAHEMRVLGDELECETIRAFEEFTNREGCRIDDRRWRHVKTHDDLRVFRERTEYKSSYTRRSTSYDDQRSIEIGPQAALSTHSNMPMMLCVGTVPSTLDDMLYALSFHDSASLRTTNHYSRDPYDDNVMLSVVEEPTADDPFNFLGLAWYLKRYHMPLLVSDRDLLVLVGGRMRQLSNGERVAVSVYHSVEHRDFPAFSDHGILRMSMTLGTIVRQLPDKRVELFITGFIEPLGSTPEMFTIQDLAKTLLLACHSPEIALLKKLYWRMRIMRRSNRSVVVEQTRCAMCRRSLGGVFASSGHACQICSKWVCDKCYVTRKLVVASTREETTFRPFTFCLRCTVETKSLNATAIARLELDERITSKRTNLSVSSASTNSI